MESSNRPSATTTVQFFFSIGSRYSYLVATQLPGLAEETGARFLWRAVSSPELIRRAGADPFAPEARRGQYKDQGGRALRPLLVRGVLRRWNPTKRRR
jgi:2-hydroxychromene-2-carboxylate isomerase